MLDKILRIENGPYFTQNFDELSSQENYWYNRYLELNREDTTSSSPVERRVPWKVEDEIRVMANVRAYFQATHPVRFIPVEILLAKPGTHLL